MLDWIGYGWMAGEISGPRTYFADLTLEIPRGDVVAAAAITASSVGVQDGEPGSVAVYVREYGTFDKAGNPHVIDMPADPTNNAVFLPDCFFVRFRMTVFQARAFSQGLVFRFAPPPPPTPVPPPVKKTKWDVHDYHVHVGGKDAGKHRVMTLARDSRMTSKAVDAVLNRASVEAARFLGVQRREIKTTRARKARPRKGDAARARVF